MMAKKAKEIILNIMEPVAELNYLYFYTKKNIPSTMNKIPPTSMIHGTAVWGFNWIKTTSKIAQMQEIQIDLQSAS